MDLQVPSVRSSSASRRVCPTTDRIGPEPTLTRFTPSLKLRDGWNSHAAQDIDRRTGGQGKLCNHPRIMQPRYEYSVRTRFDKRLHPLNCQLQGRLLRFTDAAGLFLQTSRDVRTARPRGCIFQIHAHDPSRGHVPTHPRQITIYPASMSADTGTGTERTMRRNTSRCSGQGACWPSGNPSENAIPALVVPIAEKPASSKMRALAASQALGRISMSRCLCSPAKCRAFSASE